VLVLDKIHHIKNYTSRAYAAIHKLRGLDACIMISGTQIDNTRMDGYAMLSLLQGHNIGYITVSVRTEGSTADGNEVLDERSDRSFNLGVFVKNKTILYRYDRQETRIAHHIGSVRYHIHVVAHIQSP
jgi:limonene-1,2-epoxide hydrolase